MSKRGSSKRKPAESKPKMIDCEFGITKFLKVLDYLKEPKPRSLPSLQKRCEKLTLVLRKLNLLYPDERVLGYLGGGVNGQVLKISSKKNNIAAMKIAWTAKKNLIHEIKLQNQLADLGLTVKNHNDLRSKPHSKLHAFTMARLDGTISNLLMTMKTKLEVKQTAHQILNMLTRVSQAGYCHGDFHFDNLMYQINWKTKETKLWLNDFGWTKPVSYPMHDCMQLLRSLDMIGHDQLERVTFEIEETENSEIRREKRLEKKEILRKQKRVQLFVGQVILNFWIVNFQVEGILALSTAVAPLWLDQMVPIYRDVTEESISTLLFNVPLSPSPSPSAPASSVVSKPLSSLSDSSPTSSSSSSSASPSSFASASSSASAPVEASTSKFQLSVIPPFKSDGQAQTPTRASAPTRIRQGFLPSP